MPSTVSEKPEKKKPDGGSAIKKKIKKKTKETEKEKAKLQQDKQDKSLQKGKEVEKKGKDKEKDKDKGHADTNKTEKEDISLDAQHDPKAAGPRRPTITRPGAARRHTAGEVAFPELQIGNRPEITNIDDGTKHRRKSFLKRKTTAAQETPPELKAITKKLKERPEPTGDDVHAADLIPTAIAIAVKRRSTVGELSSGIKKLAAGEEDDPGEISPITIAKEDKENEDKENEDNAPDAPNAEEEARRRKLKRIVLCVACVVVCVVVILVYLFSFAVNRALPIEDLACDTPTCHKALHLMNSFVDPSVHPCEDLYKHSCGYWLGKTSTPSSFMADVAENYSRLLHNVLSSGGAEGIGVQAGALRYVSRYYSSCMEFLGKKHTVEEIVTPFLQHMNITVKTWLGTRDRLAIFNDLVGYSVRFKLHSFFVIEMTEHLNSTPTWSTERGWAFMERVSGLAAVDSGGQDRATAYLRSVLKAIDASASTEATTSRVVELDLKRATVPSESGDSHEDHYTALGKLTCDIFEGAAWLKALQAVPGDTEKLTAQTMVHASSVEVICDELSAALRDSNPVVGPIYSLALMAAEVLRYHFALPAEDAGPAKLHAICYGATWKPFSRAWVEILSAFLGMGAHAEEFMKAYFKSITSSLDTYMDWMADTDQAKVEQKFRSYGLIGMDAPQLDVQKLRCSRYDGSIELSKDDFIYNRIMVYGYIAKDCVVPKRPLSKSVLSYLEGTELVVDSPSKVVVVPHMFGLPPLYYVQMKEDYVNYALGGTVLARKFFRVVLNGSWKKSTTEKMLTARDCYAKLSSRFHDALSEDRFHEVFSTAEAFRVAYSVKAATGHWPGSSDQSHVTASNRVFFKLACQTLCVTPGAPQDPNSLDGLTAHAACLYAAGTMPQFHRAFHCRKSNKMWRLRKCKMT